MTENERTRRAIETGNRLAEETLARRRAARANRGPSAGRLVALGDSWFDYPIDSVLHELDDYYGYDIESAARAGTQLEAMAYAGGQIDEFERCLTKSGRETKAILLSGGGNDIVADDFGMLLNSAVSPIHGWNASILSGIIETRIGTAYRVIATAINRICRDYLKRELPIVVHGYDYLVPDGRGVLGGWWFLPGPWLRPGFHAKHFPNPLQNTYLMRDVIDTLNTTLSTLSSTPSLENIHYLDLRNTLSTELIGDAYQEWWANELHPTPKGFRAVADKFDILLKKL